MKQEREDSNRREIINQLVKSKHGDLMDYENIGLEASKSDPEFFAHLLPWNSFKGEIRDSKIALPILNLRTLSKEDKEFAENAISSLMLLDPKNLSKAYEFNKTLSKNGKVISGGHRRMFEKGIKKYLEIRESNKGWFDRTAVQHRESMKKLYAISHCKPSEYVQNILFDRNYPKGSVFEKISHLRSMSPKEAAGTVLQYKIPFQIAIGSLGKKKSEYEKNPEFLLALMEGMSGQQLLNNTKFLTSLGVFRSSMLKSEYNKALERAKKDKKVSTLKAGKTIEALKEVSGVDEHLINQLSNLQDTKISQKGIEGDWVVLGDCSGSMTQAIEMAKHIASFITKSVKGKVYLIFFNDFPKFFDVTGKSLIEIQNECKYIRANGATSIGCGIKFLQEKGIVVNGIAIVSDGGDNTHPYFHDSYNNYIKKMDIQPTVYFYRLNGDSDYLSNFCKKSNIMIEKIDSTKIDYYSLPNIVSLMKTSVYGLIDEIMSTPLLTFDKVFSQQQ